MKKELSEEDIKIQEELMYRIDQGPMKFQRTSLQYSMILKLVLTPIWVSFLIIFISKWGGDVLSISYFALQPFDELFDGILSRNFLSAVNGVMINTHKKMFKWRTLINNVIKMALFMNLAMVYVQVSMIFIMANRISKNMMLYNDHNAIQKNIVGNVVVLLWFMFDAIGNIIQMYGGTHLLEWSQAIANDVQMHHIADKGKANAKQKTTNYKSKYQIGYLKMEYLQ